MKQIIRRVAALVIGLGLGAVSLAGLESVTHISDLNASWPLGSDLASTSDDHIRNIKTALKTDFPNVNAAVNPTPAQFNQLTTDTFTSAVTGNSFIPSSSTVPTNGLYLPSANSIGWATNSTTRGSISSSGAWSIAASSASKSLTLDGLSDSQMALNNSAGTQYTSLYWQASGTSKAEAYWDNSATTFRMGANVASSITGIVSGGDTIRVSVGSAGNVTVNAPTSGIALTVTPVSTSAAISSGKVSISGDTANNQAEVDINNTGASGRTWRLGDGIGVSNGTFTIFDSTGSNPMVAITSAAIQGRGVTVAGLLDMTPDTGTFTATMTGGTTSPTCTARWTRIGNLVMLEICSATATSNSTSFTYTGLPSAVQPTVTQHVPAASSAYEDNGAAQASTVEVVLTASSGTITFWHNAASTGWTNLGVKGVLSINTVSYLLN